MVKLDTLGRPNPGVAPDFGAELLTKQLKIRINEDDFNNVFHTARAKGVSMSELIRTYITWGLEAK